VPLVGVCLRRRHGREVSPTRRYDDGNRTTASRQTPPADIRVSGARGIAAGLDLGPNSKVYRVAVTLNMTSPARLRIGELAKTVGVEPDTIRFYERKELLPEPGRTASGYRVYDDSAVDRMRFIQGAQRLGLRLADIRDLLTVRDTGVCPCEPATDLLTRRLTEVDAEIRRLNELREQMASMLAALPQSECPPPLPGAWRQPAREGESDASGHC
jgi:DNA-binding transcriptional MerR regulator